MSEKAFKIAREIGAKNIFFSRYNRRKRLIEIEVEIKEAEKLLGYLKKEYKDLGGK